jgi:hypothetical protein
MEQQFLDLQPTQFQDGVTFFVDSEKMLEQK